MKKRTLRPSFVRVTVSAGVLATLVIASAPVCADPPPRPTACPADEPQRNAPCASPGLECGYRVCMGSYTYHAVCDRESRVWQVAEGTCNPPPPPPSITSPPGRNPPNTPRPPRRPRPRPRRTHNPPAT